ncbi:MAG: hypothetical protein H6656_08840 [Ardenticatenaceae bacterium]|nr:hypothetical protein [Ardenticatenaceae bacterium]
MSERFDWQIGEEEDELTPQTHTAVSQSSRLWVWLGLTAVLVFGLWWGGRTVQEQLASSERALRQQVQTALDFERDAYLAGDGDLFYSFQADDAAWFTAQLQPLNGRLYHNTPTVTHAEQHDTFIWANVQWTESGQPLQRVAFWQVQPDGGLIRQPEAPGYWGSFTFVDFAWGKLSYFQTDADLAEQIGQHITERILTLCVADCPTAERPFTITLANDFQETAAPDHLRLPSPRLVGLDENGDPSPLFWQMVDGRIADRFGAVTLRFGIPAGEFPLLDYEMAAQAFMAQNPRIHLELVYLESAEPTLAEVAGLDAVGAAPTEAMLAAGSVRPLTDLMQTDGRFNRADFYEQLWQGAWWREQMWFMPLAGRMNVLYYDKEAYRSANRPEPTIRWTWEEMVADMTAVSHGTAAQNGSLAWGFLDVGPDALLSYAYNWGNTCEEATVLCDQPLTPEAIAATLDWYHSLAGQPGQVADLTALSATERAGVLSNWQSARRRAAIWVESPLLYELRVQMDPMGALPFPGSDRFDGITPLWVQGAFVTMDSERPFAAWEWLKFLTEQAPSARFRLVPARPSVATASQFWSRLPHDLANAMRTAFPFSRPVLIEEKHLFRWEMLTAVQTGSSPETAVQIRPRLVWFEQ